jgi:hypothetical protein
MAKRVDRELEEFRSLMEVPSTFEEGFTWSSLGGAVFIALVMVPGAIYMGLLAGTQQIGLAAQWVTVILFIEVAKRAHRTLSRSEIFVLFFMAGAAMGMPFRGLLWNQFYARSDAATAYGIAREIPNWFAPAASSTSYEIRQFLHVDWIPAIALAVFGTFFSQISSMVLGYGLFRLTSDVEKLPFPMAPVGAQGIMAMAEDVAETGRDGDTPSWRWRVFAIGGALGLAFGSVYLGLPTITGALTGRPIQIFPIPFSDFTGKTQDYLPAVATGLAWDMGNLLTGMVLPFFAMLGSFVGLVLQMIANPILYRYEVLTSWAPGDDTIATLFKNNVDFYFSFQIGLAVAIALAGFYSVFRGLAKRRQKRREEAGVLRSLAAPPGRGDIRAWAIILCYFVVVLCYILVSGYLINWHRGVMIVLVVLGFFYTPLISYVTARLEGIAGQVVQVPFIREASIILSGYRGVACWFLPIPYANYGRMTVFYRQCELTGTKFTSIWKSKILLYPIILLSSIFFMNFVWSLAEVPSAIYPFANRMWELQASMQSIMFTATLGEYTIFEEAFNWFTLAIGTGFGVLLFTGMSAAGAPVFLVYGLVRGLGQTLPHAVIPQFIGALIGRYYFQRRLGLKWRQYIPVVTAGFMCGMGLVTTLCIGITFLSKSVIQLPF